MEGPSFENIADKEVSQSIISHINRIIVNELSEDTEHIKNCEVFIMTITKTKNIVRLGCIRCLFLFLYQVAKTNIKQYKHYRLIMLRTSKPFGPLMAFHQVVLTKRNGKEA